MAWHWGFGKRSGSYTAGNGAQAQSPEHQSCGRRNQRLGVPTLLAALLVGGWTCATRTPEVSFSVRDFSWEHDPNIKYGFSYSGHGTLVARGVDADSLYVLAVQIIRARRANPSQAPDSLNADWIVEGGTAPVDLSDYVSRCSEYSAPGDDCVKDAQMPVTRFRILGWQQLHRAAP